MNLFQIIIGCLIAGIFLVFALHIMWYLVVPLILLGCLIWGFNWIRFYWLSYRSSKQANGCHIRTIHIQESYPKKENVIDVDYTEIT